MNILHICYAALYLLAGVLTFIHVGIKDVPRPQYRGDHTTKREFLIVSKVDLFVCLFTSLFWPAHYLVVALKFIWELLVSLHRAWDRLPFHNPPKMDKDNTSYL